MKLSLKALLFAVTLLCTGAYAQTPSVYQPYFVSGVLKENNSAAVIKIVQGMVVSDSVPNAQVVFSAMAIKQFPGYTMVDVLASTFSQLYKTLPTNGAAPDSKATPFLSGTGV